MGNRHAIGSLYLRPQNFRSLDTDWTESHLKQQIRKKKLCPFYPATEDKQAETDEECPICMLFHPRGLNVCTSCKQPLCTTCFIQICTSLNDKSSSCPYCNHAPFRVKFKGPKSKKERLEEMAEEQRVLERTMRNRSVDTPVQESRENGDHLVMEERQMEERETISRSNHDLVQRIYGHWEREEPLLVAPPAAVVGHHERLTDSDQLRQYVPAELLSRLVSGAQVEYIEESMMDLALQMSREESELLLQQQQQEEEENRRRRSEWIHIDLSDFPSRNQDSRSSGYAGSRQLGPSSPRSDSEDDMVRRINMAAQAMVANAFPSGTAASTANDDDDDPELRLALELSVQISNSTQR